ncbi:MAG: MFS transporter [Candidatus Acidoferrales bacterium]|nr:MFS transporter [Candidatus Acidoferrales bacterium]
MARQTGFYGWKLLAVFWIILFANFAFPLYGASVVNTYMAEALHWDRTQLGTAYAIYQLMIGVPAPLISVLIAKTGARFTTAIGCWIVVGGALLMSSIVHTSWQTYIFYSFTMGLGAMTGGILVAQTGVNRWFNRYKGLAITIVHTGTTFGGFVAARLVDKVIRASGGSWRAGWWLMAGVSTIAAVIAILFVRESPADLGQFTDGATAEEFANRPAGSGAGERVHKTSEHWTLLDALRTPAIWLILISLLGFSAGYPLYIAHGNAHLRDLGYSPEQAASSISIMLLSALFGTLFFAAVADRIEPRLIWAVASVVFAVGMFLALHASGAAGLYLYAVLLGSSFGVCFSAMMVLPANYYGVKGYPPVISFMMVIGTTAGALGARIAGMVFDRIHSYTPVFYCVAGLSVLAAIVLLLMKPARKPQSSLASAAPEHA